MSASASRVIIEPIQFERKHTKSIGVGFYIIYVDIFLIQNCNCNSFSVALSISFNHTNTRNYIMIWNGRGRSSIRFSWKVNLAAGPCKIFILEDSIFYLKTRAWRTEVGANKTRAHALCDTVLVCNLISHIPMIFGIIFSVYIVRCVQKNIISNESWARQKTYLQQQFTNGIDKHMQCWQQLPCSALSRALHKMHGPVHKLWKQHLIRTIDKERRLHQVTRFAKNVKWR